MREDGKRNFLGIGMGGCGRYVFFLFFFFLEGMGRDVLVQRWNGMYDV